MFKDTLFGMGDIVFNFNRQNVKIRVSKSSAFCGGYELDVTATCSNDKLKAVAQIEKKKAKDKKACISHYNPVFSQLRIFLFTLGIDPSRIGNPSRKMDKRSSRGTKSISLNFHFDDPYYAYALGLDMGKYGSNDLPNTPEEIINREEHVRRVVEELKNLQFDNRMKSEQESQITQEDSQKIWETKFKDSWIKKLDTVRQQGITYYVFC